MFLTVEISDGDRATMQILEGLKKIGALRFGKPTNDPKVAGRIPGLAYTHRERVARVREAIARFKETGHGSTSEEITKAMQQW